MATGTGKTFTAAGVIKLFLRTGNAKRVLFLVDRLELENQAKKNFERYLGNDYVVCVYKESRDEWRNADIVVSTVQSLSFDNKYRKLFRPTDFDLVISDESHRSISGNSRAVFEYFIGYKLGLTATPKDYIKNLDTEDLQANDVRAWERRQLLDTYITFGCESGEPTFRYSLTDGVKDGFLVNPTVVDARTEITTQLLSDDGYSVITDTEEGDVEMKFNARDFEKKFFSEKTNSVLCKTFVDNALKDPISGEIGKTIVFCVSQNHAAKITNLLNEMAMKLWPGKYNSDFAVQVTSVVKGAQQFTIDFSSDNNNLNGRTRFLEDYKSSKTRVAVTVGMMTTGYDCTDLLNLCLMRPIFSPTDFIQIKGRGTRTNTFKYSSRVEGQLLERKEEKRTFKMFDFFANCEYFEEKFNYDEVLDLPFVTEGPIVVGEPPIHYGKDETEIGAPDWIVKQEEQQIGVEGMKIDRMLFQKLEDTLRADTTVKDLFEMGEYDDAVDYVKTEIFDKPNDYFNLEKIRTALGLDRRLSVLEVLKKAFGQIDRFKGKDELLDEEVDNFIATNKPDAQYIPYIRNYFKAYVTDPTFRDIIESGQFARLSTYPGFSMSEFQALNGYREEVPVYVKDYVTINRYMD